MSDLSHACLPACFPPAVAGCVFSCELCARRDAGPGVFYIVTRALTQGRAPGWRRWRAWPWQSGNAIGAAIGLAVVFAISRSRFAIVKYAGAAYLIYLGVHALRSPPDDVAAPLLRAQRCGRSSRRLRGCPAQPKTAIFFAAFPAPVSHPDASPIGQSALLGAMFVLVAAATDSAYALAASAVALRCRSCAECARGTLPDGVSPHRSGRVHRCVRSRR